MNGVTSQKIERMDVGLFWKHNGSILEKLEQERMPPHSRLVYKDVSTRQDKESGGYVAQYDLVNFYDNRKNLLKIFVEFGRDLSIRKEEILASTAKDGTRKTTLAGASVTSPGHVAWLRNMARRMVAGDALR